MQNEKAAMSDERLIIIDLLLPDDNAMDYWRVL
jgi:hypothetical protein